MFILYFALLVILCNEVSEDTCNNKATTTVSKIGKEEIDDCKFLKKLGRTSGRQYYLWRCDDELELYQID